jgi:endonuclease/exonuclease/phosphatase family metal-dependent hydrolase
VHVQLRVVDWNLDGSSALEAKLDLLAAMTWDVVLLQEVTEASWDRLRRLGDAAVWSGDHLPALSQPPRYRSAIVVRGHDLEDLGVVEGVPSPERTSTARLRVDGWTCTVASLALPPGVSWGDAGKGRQADRLACWLRDLVDPVVVGLDANAPRWDRPRLGDSEWWNEHEALLLGTDRLHDLRDAYRDVLRHDGARRAAVLAERPDGPLAVSYRRGHGRDAIDCRYDHVLVSPAFEVRDVRYLLDEARGAGSDHALVVADLGIR